MARKREIKPGFFMNEQLATLDPLARLLFAGLWTIVDRDGRILDIPKRIKVQTLPYDECDCDSLLTALHDHGFIQRYAEGETKIIQVLTFTKHQKVHPKEVPSTLPAAKRRGSDIPKSGRAGKRKTRSEGQNVKEGKELKEGKEDPEGKELKEVQAGLVPEKVEPQLPKHCPQPPASLDTPKGHEILWAWDRYKRDRGEAYRSEQGWISLLKTFEPLGVDALEKAFATATQSNHAGIFPPKGGGSSPPKEFKSRQERETDYFHATLEESRRKLGLASRSSTIIDVTPGKDGDK